MPGNQRMCDLLKQQQWPKHKGFGGVEYSREEASAGWEDKGEGKKHVCGPAGIYASHLLW